MVLAECFVDIEINDRAAESVKQEQPARVCEPILLYALRKHDFHDCERRDKVLFRNYGAVFCL